MRARLIAILILLVILLIFILQNTQHVTLRFLFWDAYVSLVVILLASFAVGVLLGFAFGRVGLRRGRRQPGQGAGSTRQEEKPPTPGLP